MEGADVVSFSCDKKETMFAAGCSDQQLRIFDIESQVCKKHVILLSISKTQNSC